MFLSISDENIMGEVQSGYLKVYFMEFYFFENFRT